MNRAGLLTEHQEALLAFAATRVDSRTNPNWLLAYRAFEVANIDEVSLRMLLTGLDQFLLSVFAFGEIFTSVFDILVLRLFATFVLGFLKGCKFVVKRVEHQLQLQLTLAAFSAFAASFFAAFFDCASSASVTISDKNRKESYKTSADNN